MFHWDDWEWLFPLDCTDSGSDPEFHTQRLIYSVPWTKILSLQGKHKTREENSRAASTENLFSSLVSCLCWFVWILFQLFVRVWTAIIFPWSNSLRLGQVRLLWTGLVFSFWPQGQTWTLRNFTRQPFTTRPKWKTWIWWRCWLNLEETFTQGTTEGRNHRITPGAAVPQQSALSTMKVSETRSPAPEIGWLLTPLHHVMVLDLLWFLYPGSSSYRGAEFLVAHVRQLAVGYSSASLWLSDSGKMVQILSSLNSGPSHVSASAFMLWCIKSCQGNCLVENSFYLGQETC